MRDKTILMVTGDRKDILMTNELAKNVMEINFDDSLHIRSTVHAE
ncbi:MAG TPA: hypothetical protein VM101_05280 [Flavitalea sp.]|nr:hypothetical protein [Flavitalea sp.]